MEEEEEVEETIEEKPEPENLRIKWLTKWLFEPENILRVVSFLHCINSPFTKVEESFNLQATHDLIVHRFNIDKYDHLEFPGVVPRTFIGPIILAAASSPFLYFSKSLGTRLADQIIVRLVLSEIVIQCFKKFREGLANEFGYMVGIWLVLIAGSQFHFMFYMSRTLPNTFALPAALLAFHYWLIKKPGHFFFFATFDAIVFRSELTMLFGLMIILDLLYKRVTFSKVLKYGIGWSLLWIPVTITVDSHFWKRTVWPEGEVFWYNTVQNQSHNWGTQPFFWYFYSAIPRALFTSIFLLAFALYQNYKVKCLVLPALGFVFLYSFLPHKELRFIIYAIPLLNGGAAIASEYLWRNRWKGFFRALLSVAVIFSIVVNSVLSISFSAVSAKNYAGGTALMIVNDNESGNEKLNIYIDNYCAQNGVSKFLEIQKNWIYNKTENLAPGELQNRTFTHLLLGEENQERFQLLKFYEIFSVVDGFQGIDFKFSRVPPVKILVEPKVFILRRKKIIDITNEKQI